MNKARLEELGFSTTKSEQSGHMSYSARWLGHKIGEMAEAYKSAKFEDVRQMYLEREPFISITPETNAEEIKAKVRSEIDQQTRQLQTLVNSLVTENMDLKRCIGLTESKLSNLEKLIRKKLAELS